MKKSTSLVLRNVPRKNAVKKWGLIYSSVREKLGLKTIKNGGWTHEYVVGFDISYSLHFLFNFLFIFNFSLAYMTRMARTLARTLGRPTSIDQYKMMTNKCSVFLNCVWENSNKKSITTTVQENA